MQRKVMISCAVTGSADTPGRNPGVPVTPEQIARAAQTKKRMKELRSEMRNLMREEAE